MPTHPSTCELRRLAVAHDVDPRSIVRELREPWSVRGMAGERARAAVVDWKSARDTAEPPVVTMRDH